MSVTPTGLKAVRVKAPLKGWNTQTAPRELAHDFAIRLENVQFDQSGAISRRAGQSTVDDAAIGGNLETLVEYVALNGTSTLFSWSDDTALNVLSGSTWSATAETFASRPAGAQISGQLILGDGTTTRYYNGTTWATPAGLDGVGANASGLKRFTTHEGRVFGSGDAQNQMTLYYSDTIDGAGVGAADWSTGGSVGGFLDLGGAIGEGDVITGHTTFLGMLVVFCENAIVFYNNAGTASVSVQKVIRGMGCLSHDSIKGIGNDVIFLSKYGFKSLKEVAVQGDAAANDASVPINNFVVKELASGNVLGSDIRATYAEKFGTYLCTFGVTTVAYNTLFNAWSSWYGVEPTVFSAHDGTVYTAGTRLHKLQTGSHGDSINGAAAVPILVTWELPPFRGATSELKVRWNRLELIYQSDSSDEVIIETWLNLNEGDISSSVLTLEPDATISTPTDMLWTGAASNDPRRAWGTAVGGTSWVGQVDLFSGDQRLPLEGISELLSIRVTNNSISPFSITAMEVYYNEGGIR